MHQAQWSPERPLPPPVSLASPSHHEKPPEAFELRRKAGHCSRVTAGPIDLIYACVQKPMFLSRGLERQAEFQASTQDEA